MRTILLVFKSKSLGREVVNLNCLEAEGGDKREKKNRASELSKLEGRPLGRKGNFIERLEPKVLGNRVLIRGRGNKTRQVYYSSKLLNTV